MIDQFKKRVYDLFSGSERTKVVKKNIAGSFFIKGLGIIVSLLLVPFTINLLDHEKYGIWMTLFSIVNWFNMMDVGIGNGFRNKFAEAVANNRIKIAKEYVQTLYSSMGLIGAFFIFIYVIINPILNWYSILNLKNDFDENISLIVLLVFILFCVQLYTKNISTILLSLQKTTLSNSLGLLANVLSLFLIFILQQFSKASLLSIALAFMISPIVVNLIFTYFYFTRDFSIYRPKLLVMPVSSNLKDLMGLGLRFFFIQVTTIVMFSCGNIIVTQLFGPSDVTPYNVAFRLYSSVQGVFTIIITPFWSAFTQANARKDYEWIKRSVKKLIYIWFVFSFAVFILWIVSPWIFRFWVGDSVVISPKLSFQFALFLVIVTWTNLFVFYVNGVGKIKLQLYIALTQLIFNIPLAIVLAKYLGIGISGVVMATNISLLLPAILIPIQYKKLITNTSYGIWSK